jgi:peptidyl-prolyl cis-trans isomerase C
MAPPKSFVIRVVVYSLVLAYGAADLLVFHGPLHRIMRRSTDPNSPEAIEAARARGEVARVFHLPIIVSQLDRAVAERLRLEGRKPEELPAGQLRLIRYAALNDLINHQLLRIKTKANSNEVPVAESEIDAEFTVFASRFHDRAELESAMRAQGIGSEKELRSRIAGRLQQQKYIDSRISDAIAVSDEEARDWYDKHSVKYRRPERLRARHVFLSTLDRDSATAKRILENALSRLRSGHADFAGLAAELSEDDRTKSKNGDLGWFSRDRMPADFTKAVFALPGNTPTLVRSKIGWHLVEVLDRKAAEPVPFAEAKPEIVAALEAERRRYAVREFIDSLRRRENSHIHVFRNVIDAL